MKMNKFLHCAVLLGAAAVPATTLAQAVLSERTISLAAAQEAATVALEQCRKDGYNVTVTVVNRAGRVKVTLQGDGTGPHTIENSFRKAYTAVTFRVPSGEIGKRVAANPGQAGTLHLANVTGAEGALPIRAGNEVVGAIGVSGAPGGDKDAVCAQAGIDRISKGLSGG